MASSSQMVQVLDHCQISPPPGSVDDKSIPITFFDMSWLHSPFTKLLFFYEFPQPKTYFVNTIIPQFKLSLSLALKRFFSLSGNLIFPIVGRNSIPELRYKKGDSVSLTFAECSSDFVHFIGNNQRPEIDFQPFAASPNWSDHSFVVPLLAIRVTVFPNSGICIGFTHHQVVTDADMFLRFVRSWASINKLGEDATLVESRTFPVYDRTVIKNPINLRSTFWNHFEEIMKSVEEARFQPPPIRINSTVVATFTLRRAEVQRLKKCIILQIPELSQVSAFAVVCGYVWSCMVKARGTDGVNGDDSENLVFPADCRTLLDPPIPTTYFGNCLNDVIVTARCTQLIQEDGFIVATKLIQEAIQERVLKNEQEYLKATQKWVSDSKSLDRTRMVAVSGSPSFDAYDTDFGFGGPKKFEILSPPDVDSFSLSLSKAKKYDFEVGLRLPEAKMDAFVEIFKMASGVIPQYSPCWMSLFVQRVGRLFSFSWSEEDEFIDGLSFLF